LRFPPGGRSGAKRRMEASEKPRISLSRVEGRGVVSLVGDESAVRELIASDDRRTGFARLNLMLSTVLERLTRTDPPVTP
jgi:hypothetical protein